MTTMSLNNPIPTDFDGKSFGCMFDRKNTIFIEPFSKKRRIFDNTEVQHLCSEFIRYVTVLYHEHINSVEYYTTNKVHHMFIDSVHNRDTYIIFKQYLSERNWDVKLCQTGEQHIYICWLPPWYGKQRECSCYNTTDTHIAKVKPVCLFDNVDVKRSLNLIKTQFVYSPVHFMNFNNPCRYE